MKVYVLTEIDSMYVGSSPNTIQLFIEHDKAVDALKKMYNLAKEKFAEKQGDGIVIEGSGGYATLGNGDYRLDIYECELDLRDYIHDIQEMTVVVEERGVRTKLMERSKSRPDVWGLVQQWTEEFHEKSKDWDWGTDHYFYDEVDAFVDQKNKELDTPYPEIARRPDLVDSDIMEISDENFFGDDEEHEIYMTAEDGIARGDGIIMEYPKLADLTEDQIDEIEEYTGRIFDSKCIIPWDVCLLYGKITSFGIMDTGQNHPEELVRRINVAWVLHKDKFKPILVALYERDIDEITDADSFMLDNWLSTPQYKRGKETGDWTEYNKLVLEIMRVDWDSAAENYLMHIADGKDLQCILDFVRG